MIYKLNGASAASQFDLKASTLLTWQHISIFSNSTAVYSNLNYQSVAKLPITMVSHITAKKQNMFVNRYCSVELKSTISLKNLKIFDGLMETDEILSELYRNDGVSFKGIQSFSKGLIHHWPMSGWQKGIDIVGSKNMTDLQKIEKTTDRFDKADSALLFNGGYAFLPPGVYFNPATGGFTVMFWLRLLSFNNTSQGVIAFGNGNKDTINIRFQKKENMIILETCFDFTCIWIKLGTLLDTLVNKWNHYTSVYETDSGEVGMYLNSRLIFKGRINDSDIAAFQKVVRTDNYIGTITGYDNFQNLHAKVNDLKIFDRPLKTIQIRKEMSTDLGKMIEFSVRN